MESQVEFCERHQVGLSSLRHWLYRLRRETREALTSGGRFVPVVASFAELPPASYVAELLRPMDR